MFPNVRIFVGILDQRAAFFHVDVNAVLAALAGNLAADGIKLPAVPEREMARRLRTGVEMLMKPAPWRTVNAARLPLHFDDFITMAGFIGPRAEFLRPEKNVSR